MNYRPAISFFQGLLSFVGVCVAGYVYVEKQRDNDVPCILGYTGCTQVTTSAYAHLGPIDVSQLGIAAYVVLLFLAVIKGTAENEKLPSVISWLMLAMTSVGFCYSWYLQYVAKYEIGAFCIWCRISAIDMTTLFAVTIVELILLRRALNLAEHSDPSIVS